MSTTQERPAFYTPADLCTRWQIDRRTLDKICEEFGIEWGWLTPRVRRVSAELVVKIERAKGLVRTTS